MASHGWPDWDQTMSFPLTVHGWFTRTTRGQSCNSNWIRQVGVPAEITGNPGAQTTGNWARQIGVPAAITRNPGVQATGNQAGQIGVRTATTGNSGPPFWRWPPQACQTCIRHVSNASQTWSQPRWPAVASQVKASHGHPLSAMASCGQPWLAVAGHGQPWPTMTG